MAFQRRFAATDKRADALDGVEPLARLLQIRDHIAVLDDRAILQYRQHLAPQFHQLDDIAFGVRKKAQPQGRAFCNQCPVGPQHSPFGLCCRQR